MALTYVQYTGDGVTKQYTLTFPYLSKDHVFVRVDDTSVPFTWLNDSTIVLDTAPETGQAISIFRSTPRDEHLVTFKAGAGFREQDLNLMTTQVFYIVQESLENLDTAELYLWRTETLAAKNTAVEARSAAVEASNAAVAAAEAIALAQPVILSARDTVVLAEDAVLQAKVSALQAAVDAVEAKVTAVNAASAASADKDTASEKATIAIEAAEIATAKADIAVENAALAEGYANIAFGASAPAWDAATTYNYPDVVAFTDGHTYRCTGSNVLGASYSPVTSKQDWQRISVEQGRQFFEHDENGDYTPTLDPYAHDGVDGNSVLVGEGDPSSGLGKVGDSYIDKVSWGFWEKRSVIGWVNTGNVGSNFAAKTFVHQQIAASAEWVIEHNLGKKPSVTIVSSSGEVVLGKVVYMSDNALTIYFRAPFSGEAYLN